MEPGPRARRVAAVGRENTGRESRNIPEAHGDTAGHGKGAHCLHGGILEQAEEGAMEVLRHITDFGHSRLRRSNSIASLSLVAQCDCRKLVKNLENSRLLNDVVNFIQPVALKEITKRKIPYTRLHSSSHCTYRTVCWKLYTTFACIMVYKYLYSHPRHFVVAKSRLVAQPEPRVRLCEHSLNCLGGA